MENKKNNKGVIAILIVIIIILSTLCVLFATGTIKYETNNITNNINNDETNGTNNNELSSFEKEKVNTTLDETLKLELENTFAFVYDYYYDSPNGYCGNYSTFDEMIDNLKEYMTETLIHGQSSTNKNEYKEENGKLICPDYGKGGSYLKKDFTIKYNEIYTNYIYTTIEASIEGLEDNWKELYRVTFEKKDNKWIVSSWYYEKLK